MFNITRLQDGLFEIPEAQFLYVGDDAQGSKLRTAKTRLNRKVPVNCFLLRHDGEFTMIDSGTGLAWGPDLGKARDALAAENVTPEMIDRVILTHIHGDHALGLFQDDKAYFPRARIIVPREELDFWTDPAVRNAAPTDNEGTFAIADALLQHYAGRIDEFTGNYPLPGIEAIKLPGHTPGHTGYLFASNEGQLLLWGDALHVPAAQAPDPRFGLAYDNDAKTGYETRLAILARAADEGFKVSGGHLDGFFRVTISGAGYQLT